MRKTVEATQGVSTNIFYLPFIEQRLQQIQNEIAAQNFQLPVLIHPFFDQYEVRSNLAKKKARILEMINKSQNQTKKARLRRTEVKVGVTQITIDQYYLRLQKLLKTAQFGVFLLGESSPYIASTVEIIRTIGYGGDLLVYATKDANPAPVASEGSWKQLAEAIRLINAQEVYVVGQRIEYNQRKYDEHRPTGCVPRFVAELRAELPEIANQIIVSPISYPNWWKSNSAHPFFRTGIHNL